MAINVVEIIVRAKDETAAAFAEADASSHGLAKTLAKTALIGAAAFIAIGAEATKMAVDFQSNMERLATQAGVPQANIAGLSSAVLKLAGQVGFSPNSLSESLYHVASNMASMGAKTSTMMNVVRVAAEGAKVGGADLVDVTNALTAAVASGIPGVKNYSQAMGALNAIVGSGDMKMQDLAEAFGSGMVATVKGFGLSLADVGAALATFGDNNIRGAHAGTQLRMSVMALAAPAKAGQQQLQAWGYSANQLAVDMEHGGLLKALEDLNSMFKKNGVTAKTEGQYITNMFGKKAGAGLNVLMDQLDRLKSKYPAIAKGATQFGDAWQKTQATVKQKLDELGATFDALMVSIGEKLLPVVSALASFVLDTLIPAIGQVISFLARNKDYVIAAAIAIASVLLPAFIAWAASAAAAAAATIAAAAPVVLLTALVAGIAIGIVYLAKHWKEVWHDIKAWTADAVDFIRGSWDGMVHDLEQWTRDVVQFIRGSWDGMVHDLEQWASDVVNWIIARWNDLRSGTGRVIHDVVTFFEQLPGKILHALESLGSMLFGLGERAIEDLWNGLKNIAGSVIHWAASIGHDIANALGSIFGIHFSEPSEATVMVRAGQKIVQGLARGMRSGMGEVRAAAAEMAGLAFMPGAGGSTQSELTIRFQPTGVAFIDALMESLRAEIRHTGGGGPNSVQIALGRTA